MAVLGIRREDKSVWERRVPLVPSDVQKLAAQGVRIQVQRSGERCFADADFEAAGAELVDDLREAQVIVGVKEIPVELIEPAKTYLFFSHTIKGQPYNMPLLRRILDQRCSLLDYELITDEKGLRTVAFGRHAGLAGAVDTLHALGQRLLRRGHRTPLADIPGALECGEISVAREHIEAAGRRIAEEGLPASLSPLAIAVTGEGGKVWSGAMEILDLLPTRQVEPDRLAHEVEAFSGKAHELWVVSYGPGDLVEPLDPADHYEWEDYLHQPWKYRARFGAHLQHLTAVIHGIFWAEGYPRFIIAEQLRALFHDPPTPRLEHITDVTCDPGGSNELLAHTTEPGRPAYVWNPTTGDLNDGLDGDGVSIWAVDILPAEIPADASRFFSEVLSPLVPALARDDVGDRPDDEDFPDSLRGAFIAVRGELLPHWQERLAVPLREHGGDTGKVSEA